jgi:hypothetical protein
MDVISVGGRGVPVVVGDSNDLLQSVMKEVSMFMLLLVCVGSGVQNIRRFVLNFFCLRSCE